jgi:hypothetical protein
VLCSSSVLMTATILLCHSCNNHAIFVVVQLHFASRHRGRRRQNVARSYDDGVTLAFRYLRVYFCNKMAWNGTGVGVEEPVIKKVISRLLLNIDKSLLL